MKRGRFSFDEGAVWVEVPRTRKMLECTEDGDFRHSLSGTSIDVDLDIAVDHYYSFDNLPFKLSLGQIPIGLVESFRIGRRLYVSLLAENAVLWDSRTMLAEWLQTKAITLMSDDSIKIEEMIDREKRWRAFDNARLKKERTIARQEKLRRAAARVPVVLREVPPDVRQISTSQLSDRLGIVLSSKEIIALGFLPVLKAGHAIYWLESDLPDVALALAKQMMDRAIELQAQLPAAADGET